jgi:hypothetical protein
MWVLVNSSRASHHSFLLIVVLSQAQGGRQGVNTAAGDVGDRGGSGTGTDIVIGGMQVRMHHVLA